MQTQIASLQRVVESRDAAMDDLREQNSKLKERSQVTSLLDSPELLVTFNTAPKESPSPEDPKAS